jgi:hypothetical protein
MLNQSFRQMGGYTKLHQETVHLLITLAVYNYGGTL